MTFLRTLMLVVTMVVAAAGCGGSNAQVSAAKTAQYRMPAKSLLDVAIQVAQKTYKISPQRIDVQANMFATDPQFYSKEGGRIGTRAGGFSDIGPGDVQVWFLVSVSEIDASTVFVKVTAKVMQLVIDSPQPRELVEGDPNIPGWVLGRTDELTLEIYEAAKQYAVAPGAASAAAPAAAPSAAPGAEPAPAPSAAPGATEPAPN